jgi:hypothetical protein
MMPSLSRLNRPSLPAGAQPINEAYMLSIAQHYPKLTPFDVILYCVKDPTYKNEAPLQTGQYFKWLLLERDPTKLDNIFQAALNFWSAYGGALAQLGPRVLETAERLIKTSPRVWFANEVTPDATEEWMSQPLNSPEFWLQAAFIIRVVDGMRTDEDGGPLFKGEVPVSTTGTLLAMGVRDMAPFEALCQLVAESVTLIQRQMKPDDSFIDFAAGAVKSHWISQMQGSSPFTEMSPLATLVYKALCLRLPYKAQPPQAEDEPYTPRFQWGQGLPFAGGSNKISILSDLASPTDSPPEKAYSAMEQNFRAAGLSGFADLIETNTKASAQKMLAFSQALIRKGKRL